MEGYKPTEEQIDQVYEQSLERFRTDDAFAEKYKDLLFISRERFAKVAREMRDDKKS